MKLLKFFSQEKCLDTILLNLIGFQAARYLTGKIFFSIKLFLFPIKKGNVNKFNNVLNRGYDEIKNFLPQQDFSEIKKEFFQAVKDNSKDEEQVEIKSKKDGIEYKTLYVDDNLKNKYPKIYNFKYHPLINEYFSTCEQKKNFHLFCRLEKIKVIDEKIDDPNKDYHYDTFHNTFKCWLFIDKVETHEGPFRYLPYSNRFSIKRFFFEWKLSLLFSFKKDVNASFRVDKKFKKKLDKESISMDVEENTLVMANTHGLHRRGDARIGSTRYAIQFWTRENPFKIILN